MVQRRSRARFPSKAFDGRAIAGESFRQKLQRDFTSEGQVLGEVHHTHTAATEQRFDAIVADHVTRRHGASMVLEVWSRPTPDSALSG